MLLGDTLLLPRFVLFGTAQRRTACGPVGGALQTALAAEDFGRFAAKVARAPVDGPRGRSALLRFPCLAEQWEVRGVRSLEEFGPVPTVVEEPCYWIESLPAGRSSVMLGAGGGPGCDRDAVSAGGRRNRRALSQSRMASAAIRVG